MIRRSRTWLLLVPVCVFLPFLTAAPVPAADAPRASVGADRLFLGFAEEASVAQRQWWEGRLEFTDGDPTDVTLLRGVVALQPVRDLEIGARIGFGSTDAPAPLPDGSGATDLDVWGKWRLGTVGGDTEFAVGALATVPTGDDTAGLGYDAFDFEAFGSLRHRLPRLVFSGYLGIRFNGDGQIQGFELNGKTSGILGAGVLVPVSDEVVLVGEARMESERFDGGDSDFRILGGADWHVSSRGTVRGAVVLGLTDGAPDGQVLVGYAHRF